MEKNCSRRFPALAGTLLLLLFGWNSICQAQSVAHLTVMEPHGADNLNPLTHLSATGSYIGEYLYFSLLKTDKATGQFVPQLAEGLPKVSADGRSYTYRLHPQARFNNGKRIEVGDVVFSMKLLKNPFANNEHARGSYSDIVAVVPGEAEGEFQILLAHPSAQGLRLTGDVPILSADYFDPDEKLAAFSFGDLHNPDGLGPDQKDDLRTLAEKVNAFGNSFESYDPDAVSGPYLLKTWVRRQKVVLEVNKRFWGQKLDEVPNAFFKQNVGEITFLVGPEEGEMRSGIFNQGVDLVVSTPAHLFFELSDIPSLQSNYRFHSQPGPAYEYVGINMRGPSAGGKGLFEDSEVRRALALALDVNRMLETQNFGLGARVMADCPNQQEGYRNESLEPLKQDIEQAVSLLRAAGWEDRDDNGLVDKQVGGEQVQLVAECIYNEKSPHRAHLASALQQAALRIGVMVKPVPVSWEEYLKRLNSGQFDLFLGAWVADPNEDSYRQIWHTESQNGGFNFVGFGNPASDRLIERYDQTTDDEERKTLGHVIQAMMYEQQPYVFLWSVPYNLVVHQKFSHAPLYQESPGFWLAEWE